MQILLTADLDDDNSCGAGQWKIRIADRLPVRKPLTYNAALCHPKQPDLARPFIR